MSAFASTPPLRVGLVQYRPDKANPQKNFARIRERVAEVAATHDLVVFPEASLTGYFLQGGVLEVASSAAEVAEGLGVPPADAPDLVVGFYERWRHRLYNSVAYLTPAGDRWSVLHVHRKLFLPTYGVFDEARFVEHGTELKPVDTRFGRIGMLICEEMWHSLPATVLAVGGADLILVVSASPARDFTLAGGATESGEADPFGDEAFGPSNLRRWERLARSTAQEHGVFVAVAQLVGSEGGKLFAGCGLAVDPDGSILARGPRMEEGVVTALLEPSRIDRARAEAPLLADLEQMLPHLQRALADAPGLAAPPADAHGASPGLVGRNGFPAPLPRGADLLELDLSLVTDALVDFIYQEVVARRGFERVVLGVSGGVDSAVSLALAVRALGADNVFGFRMPYATSSAESIQHADLAFDHTGAQARTIEITGPVDAYVDAFEPDASPQRRGNLMARMRAMILFDQSAKLRALPLGTGNKSERLLGYYTWHADDSPPINPLGDLFKTQVWALAHHLGVPAEIVDKPASADLIVGVHDADELGIGYPDADPILYWLVRGHTPEYLTARGFDEHEVELVARRLNSTHWKRELPTVALLSSSAIGEFYLRPVDY